jgi:hypothetical protein
VGDVTDARKTKRSTQPEPSPFISSPNSNGRIVAGLCYAPTVPRIAAPRHLDKG